MVVSLNYCSQNGGKLYRAPYYNENPNIGPRIIGNLDQSPYRDCRVCILGLYRDNGKENGNYYRVCGNRDEARRHEGLSLKAFVKEAAVELKKKRL